MTLLKNNPFLPAENISLYQTLYTHVRTAILSGELPADSSVSQAYPGKA